MYFCKNCGEPYMTDEAVMCVKCGVAKGQGNNYCHNCGKPLAPDAAVCLNCGVANKQAPAPDAKSKLVAGLLAIFLGTFGVHNFYLGYTGKAVTQLVLSIIRIIPQMYSLRQLQQLLYSSRRTKKPMYWLLSAWYWVSFPSYLDAAPDGSAHCLESVVSFAQYLPTSRARPAWQRLD